MHFLLTKRDCEVAGDTTYLLMLAEGLLRRGHQVTMAAGGGGLARRFREAGARVLRLPPHPLLGPALKWRARRLGLDAIVCTGRGPARWAAYDLAASLGVPCVCTLQDHIELHESIDEFDQVGALVTVEQPIADDAIARGVEPEKVRVWPRPVRSQELGPAPEDGFPILWMGRMSGRKVWSARVLLEAAPQILRAIPGATLTLVGGGTRGAAIRRTAAKLCRTFGADAVQVEGFTLRPLDRMASASLIVGGGYTCLEALYNGRPAIAAGFGWQGPMTADQIHQGYGQHFGDRVFEPTTAPQMAEAVLAMHASLSEEGVSSRFQPQRDWFPINHSLDNQAERMEQLVQQLYNGGRATGEGGKRLAG